MQEPTNNFVICAFMGVLHYLPFQIVYNIIVTLLQELKKLYLYAVNNIYIESLLVL